MRSFECQKKVVYFRFPFFLSYFHISNLNSSYCVEWVLKAQTVFEGIFEDNKFAAIFQTLTKKNP